MASYSVLWKPSALREIRKLEVAVVGRVHRAVSALSENPYSTDSEKLKRHEHTYRIRVGDYRVIYSVVDAEKQVHVLKIGHRREVYRG